MQLIKDGKVYIGVLCQNTNKLERESKDKQSRLVVGLFYAYTLFALHVTAESSYYMTIGNFKLETIYG